MILTYSLVGVALLCAVHVFAHAMRFLEGTPRSRWLSFASGISLAYVFLHFMPELAEGQELAAEGALSLPFVEFELYGIALIGLLAYYGMERLVQEDARMGRAETPDGTGKAEREPQGHGTFWVHLTSFAIYNLITGYLLVRRAEAEEPEAAGPLIYQAADASLLLFALAMALHFVVTDYGLREDFREGWLRIGRWVLCLAVVAGWTIGVFVALPEIAVLGIIALLGGGVILNVLKEELPAERQSRFWALVTGAAAYAALLAFTH